MVDAMAPIVGIDVSKHHLDLAGGGRPSVRCAIYMATLSAIRCEPSLKTFYHRLRQAGKKPKVALVAAMRKLVTLLNTLLQRDQPWGPQQHGC